MSLRLTIHSPDGGAFDLSFDEPEVKIGRASFCAVRLPYQVVSSHHLTIEGADGDWCFVDVGSTNGTVVEGRRLAEGEQVWIRDGLVATIVDVEIEFHIVRDYVKGFTLAESGTMLRRMMHESSAVADEDLAFLEVMRGTGVGRRFAIDDGVQEAVLGPGRDRALRFTELDDDVLTISRDGEGFRARPIRAAVQVGGETVSDDGCRLSSGDRVVIGAWEFLFVDPLEAYLREMDGDDPAPAATGDAADDERSELDQPDDVEARSDEQPQPGGADPRARLTAFEWTLMIVSVVVIVAGVGALLVILGLV